MKIIITKDKLSEATSKGIITQRQEEELWNLFCTNSSIDRENSKITPEESTFVKMLYSSGAFIIIGAMSWFMNRAWNSWNGAGIGGIALFYALAFILIGRIFSKKSKVLSDQFYVMAVAMTPLFTYGVQKWLGFWPDKFPGDYQEFHMYIKGGWMTIELVTLLVSTVALRYIKNSLAMAIPAFVLWYISMDITPLLFGYDDDWNYRKYVSIFFGVNMIIAAFIIDNRRTIDYPKWLYIFGTITFWCGISALDSTNEWSKLLYFIINITMMCAGTLLNRTVFIIFGSLGCIGYIGHLAYSIFYSSSFFPIALAGFGLFIILIGWFCHKNREIIKERMLEITPQTIIARLPQNRK
ncbi:hypothetical protein [Pelosinus sp. sgz500959]|uniref:hypothetical protein n=1 Tax=Pelosinus sp. sgz500959 TaxID=3242472 RepID=UPI00366EB5D4